MDEVAEDNSIYLFSKDKETFRLHRVERNAQYTKRVPVQWRDLVDKALKLEYPLKGWEDYFWHSALILEAGEAQQRQVIERISRRNGRNIKMKLDSIRGYAGTTFGNDNPYRKIEKMQIQRLMELLKSGLDTVRTELNFPTGNPTEFSYEITDKVVNAAPNERFRQFLERVRDKHQGAIYQDLYEKIKAQIEERLPEESDEVLRLFEGTRNREHLAAISVTSEDDELCVSLVNIHGQRIRMEAWKFVNLLENPGTALRLADLTSSGFREQSQAFLFNLKKKGKVVGKFTPARATIEVVCLQESDNSVCDNGTFVIDIDYALCVYVAAKRLRDDKERFNRLKEQAGNAIEHDPFDAIYQSLEVS